jgi:predicted small integral membrane protein
MFDFRDLFQWDRFITPSIVKTFYLLIVIIAALAGLLDLFGGIAMIGASPIAAVGAIIAALLRTIAEIIAVRIAAEFVLITFRINEHLGALRHNSGR